MTVLRLLYDYDYIGVFLPKLCEGEVGNGRRGMAEIGSSGVNVAAVPLSSEKFIASSPEPQQSVKFIAEPFIAPPPYN